MANWIFGAAAVFFGAAFYIRLHEESLWASVLYFAAQSALIGGAADWFAVTALFRKPLGFPFHTALIPRNRGRIVSGIRRMVENKLVRPEMWNRLLGTFSASGALRVFLKTEKGQILVGQLAEEAAGMAEEMLMARKPVIQDILQKSIPVLEVRLCNGWKERLTKKEMADRLLPLFLSGAETVLKKEKTRSLLIAAFKEWTDSQKKNPLIAMAISMGESMGLIHYEDMADAFIGAADAKIQAWKAADAPMQMVLRDKICRVLGEIAARKETDAFLQMLAKAILSALPVAKAAGSMEESLKGQWNSKGKAAAETMLKEGIETILSDAEICRALDREAGNLLTSLALYEHTFIGETAEAVLSAYDDQKLNAFVGDKVGEELGWIRINGIWVAAVSGAVLFLLVLLARHLFTL